MGIDIVTRHFDLPADFADLINRRYKRLRHYSNRVMSGRMIIESDGANYRLEFLLQLRGGQINVHTLHTNLVVGVNNLFNKLRRRLKKEEEMIKDHRMRGR